MVRLRSSRTGSVVNVDDVTAARLGQEWGPVEAAAPVEEKPAPKKPARSRRRASSKSADE